MCSVCYRRNFLLIKKDPHICGGLSRKTERKWTDSREYSNHGGEAHDCRRMADAQQPALFSSAADRKFPATPLTSGGGALPGAFRERGFGSATYTDRTKFTISLSHYEQELMRKEILCGGQKVSCCPPTITTIPGSATPPC